jgi:hypothetical protein
MVNIMREGANPGAMKKLMKGGNRKAPANMMAQTMKGPGQQPMASPIQAQANTYLQRRIAKRMAAAGAGAMSVGGGY